MKVSLNGTLVEADAARIDPRDRGFTLSDGVFEKPEQREEVIRLFRKGQEVYRKIAAEGRAPARP